MPQETADIRAAGDATRGIGGVDRAVTHAHQAADFAVTGDATQAVTVADAALVLAHQTSGTIGTSRHTARGVAVGNGGEIPACKATDVIITTHRPRGIAGADAVTSRITAHQTANVAAGSSRADDIAAGGTVAHRAGIEAYQAADIPVSTHCTTCRTIRDGGVIFAHQAAKVFARATRHRGRRTTGVDRTHVVADQAADIVAATRHAAAGTAVADRARVQAHQGADIG